MEIQETLSTIQKGFSDPSVSQARFDQLQSDKAAATQRIVDEMERLAAKYNVPSSDFEDVAAEVVSALDTMTIQPESEYREEIGCRLDCRESQNLAE